MRCRNSKPIQCHGLTNCLIGWVPLVFIRLWTLPKDIGRSPYRPYPKSAFTTPFGLHQFVTLPFGLFRAPATLQRLMDKILRPHTAYAAAYLDDIIIYSQDWHGHMVHLREVLRALRGAGLTANPKKCAIGWVEVRYLGFHLGHGQVLPQIDKTAAIAVLTLRYYLLGREFTLCSDHAPLQWLHRMKDTNARIAHWYLALQPFKFKVIHRPGTQMTVADFLSRNGGGGCRPEGFPA